MNDEPMKRKQVEDLLENLSLKFTNILTEKLEEYGDKQKDEQRLARENTFEAGTGFRWEDRDRVKAALSYADRAQKYSFLWKSAGVVTMVGLIVKAAWGSFFNV